jgi:hypothetical protein
MIKINYLFPIMVEQNNKEYLCFIDYSRDKIFFLDNVDQNLKESLTKEVLSLVNNKNLIDVDNKTKDVFSFINEIKNTKIKKATEESFNKDKKNE